jgi:hypothetical protein
MVEEESPMQSILSLIRGTVVQVKAQVSSRRSLFQTKSVQVAEAGWVWLELDEEVEAETSGYDNGNWSLEGRTAPEAWR